MSGPTESTNACVGCKLHIAASGDLIPIVATLEKGTSDPVGFVNPDSLALFLRR